MNNAKDYEQAVEVVSKQPQLLRYSAALNEVQRLTGDRHSKSARFQAWSIVLEANKRSGLSKSFWEPSEQELRDSMSTRVGYSGLVPPDGPFMVFFKLGLVLVAVGSVARCALS